jgi:N6-adenosine-specific RNA methylase IME4
MIKTVLLDPPWNERGAGKCKRGADRHYDVMKTSDIAKVIVSSPYWQYGDGIAENAHMYMWVTNNYLKDGLWLMEFLGFEYKTNLVWAKDKFGIGRYFRGQHEICLFGTKGDGWEVRTDRNDIPTLLTSKRTKHSKKPLEFYDIIEGRSKGDFLELFARQERDGWYSWGNEIEQFKPIPSKPQLTLW